MYIMVTYYSNHWDHLVSDTYYTKNMFRNGMRIDKIKEKTQTIFIKRNNQTNILERAWIGFVYNFKIEDSKIYFNVKIKNEIPIAQKYSNYRDGWYIEDSEFNDDVYDKMDIYPPFFNFLKTTTDWPEFENLTFLLLKLLGIHEIYRYEKQRGTADGFFKFKNSVVIYDCTLENDFEKAKETQINNFCDQLKHETIRHELCVMDINKCHKQVWIITRGPPRMINKRVGDILVKEVSVDKIIRIYRNRLVNNIDENALENQLRDI